uniref:Uncharacterized protein n=1 Tax=Anopheles quadriannulatus TaxID=34691 RepID=A0A182XC04_ANOQN
MDIAKATCTVNSFLWDGSGGFRVPLQQLALPRIRGGLNLHLPAIMAKALLTNRGHHDTLDSPNTDGSAT